MSQNMGAQSAQPDWAKPISTGIVNPSGKKNEPQLDWATPISRGTVGPSGKTHEVPALSHTPDSIPDSVAAGSPQADQKPDWATPVSFGIMHPLGYTTEVAYALPDIKAPTPVRPHAAHKIIIPTPKGTGTFGVKTPSPPPGPPPNTPSKQASDGTCKRWEIKTPPPKTPSPTPAPPNTSSNQLAMNGGIRKRWEIKTPPPPKTPSPTPGSPPNTPQNKLSLDGIRKVWEIKTPPPKTPSPAPASPNTPSNQLAMGDARKRWKIKTPPPTKTPSPTPGGPPNSGNNQLAMVGDIRKKWEIKTPPPPKTPSPTPGGPPNTPNNQLAAIDGFRKRWEIKTPPPPKTPSPITAPPNTPSGKRTGVKTPPPSPGPSPNTPSKRRGVHFAHQPEYIPVIACGPKLNNTRLRFEDLDRKWEPPSPLPPAPDGILSLVGTMRVPAHAFSKLSKDRTPPPPPDLPPNTPVKRFGVKTQPPSTGPPPNTPSKRLSCSPSPPPFPPPFPPEPYFAVPLDPPAKRVGVKTPPPSPGPPPNTPSKQASRQPREYSWTRDVKRESVGLRGGAWPYDGDDEAGPSKKNSGVFPLDDGEKKAELVREVEETVRAVTESYKQSLEDGAVETPWGRGQRILMFREQEVRGAEDTKGKGKAVETDQQRIPSLLGLKTEDINRWVNSPKALRKHTFYDGRTVDTATYLGDDNLEVELELLFPAASFLDAPWRMSLLRRFGLNTPLASGGHRRTLLLGHHKRPDFVRPPHVHSSSSSPGHATAVDIVAGIIQGPNSIDTSTLDTEILRELPRVMDGFKKGDSHAKELIKIEKKLHPVFKYDPDQDCFVFPRQKHPPEMRKAETQPAKKPKAVRMEIDDEDAADRRISRCFYVIRDVGIMSGTSDELYLATVELLAELSVEELWTLKCVFAVTSAGPHIVGTQGMLELEDMVHTLPVNRLPEPLQDIADNIRKQLGKPPSKNMSLQILLRVLRAGRQELINDVEDGPEKSRILEDVDLRIARVEAGDRSAVYSSLDAVSLNGDSAEDVPMNEELEEGEILKKCPEKSLKERVHALNFTLRVFNPATPYNEANFNRAQDMLSEMSPSDLATFIRRLRVNLGGESGPGANEHHPDSVLGKPRGARHERKLREMVERIVDGYLMLKYVEADMGMGARPGEERGEP